MWTRKQRAVNVLDTNERGLAARWIAVVTIKFSATLMLFLLARGTANLLRVCRMLVRFYFTRFATASFSVNRIMSGYRAWAKVRVRVRNKS